MRSNKFKQNLFLMMSSETIEDNSEEVKQENNPAQPVDALPVADDKKIDASLQNKEEVKNENSEVQVETEITLYGQITNFEGLKEAKSKETHEQYEIKPSNTEKGRFRVRKTTYNSGEIKYVLTIKIKSDSNVGRANSERNIDIDEGTFEDFKLMSSEGMLKDRYTFEVSSIATKDSQDNATDVDITEPTVWEIDVYPDESGGYAPWVKIDLELDGILKALEAKGVKNTSVNLSVNPKKLPIGLTNIIENNDETKGFITDLYNKHFMNAKVK